MELGAAFYHRAMLQPIVEAAERRAERAAESLDRLRRESATAPATRSLAAAVGGPGLSVIAEVKRRSPSAGPLAEPLDPAAQAIRYMAGGAAGVSVLTEPDFFGGSLDDLRAVRAAIDRPVLRKDFIVHAAQIFEARAAGADAVLLIVALVDPPRLVDLLTVADEAGVEALVEAHDEREAAIAVESGARIVGVNNRDLRTFVTDLAVAERVAPVLPSTVVKIAESGVSDPDGARRMADAGYDAILVGEAAVRAEDPAALIARLRRADR